MDFMCQKGTPKETSIYPHLFFLPLAQDFSTCCNKRVASLACQQLAEVNNANTFKGLKLTATNSEELGELIIKNVEQVILKKESDDCKVWSLKVDKTAVETHLH